MTTCTPEGTSRAAERIELPGGFYLTRGTAFSYWLGHKSRLSICGRINIDLAQKFSAAMNQRPEPSAPERGVMEAYRIADIIRCLQTAGRTGREVADHICSELKAHAAQRPPMDANTPGEPDHVADVEKMVPANVEDVLTAYKRIKAGEDAWVSTNVEAVLNGLCEALLTAPTYQEGYRAGLEAAVSACREIIGNYKANTLRSGRILKKPAQDEGECAGLLCIAAIRALPIPASPATVQEEGVR